MEEYRQRDTPTATSDEHQEVEMNAWQRIVAEYDRELADGKETFTRTPTQQEEYSMYVAGAVSTFDTLGFWKVRSLQIHHIIYSHKLSTDVREYVSNDLSHRNGLFAHSGIRCPM
jgi:hypothetical protein